MKKEICLGNVSLKRNGCSVAGNPRFLVGFFAGGMITTGKSLVNASWCYAFNTGYYENVVVEYHVTKSGKVIFDDVRKAE